MNEVISVHARRRAPEECSPDHRPNGYGGGLGERHAGNPRLAPILAERQSVKPNPRKASLGEKILLDAHEAAELLSVSLRQIRNLQKEPTFPAPRSLGPRSTRWLRTELEQYALALPSVKQRDEPAQLAAARADKAAGLTPLPGPFSHAPAAHQPS